MTWLQFRLHASAGVLHTLLAGNYQKKRSLFLSCPFVVWRFELTTGITCHTIQQLIRLGHWNYYCCWVFKYTKHEMSRFCRHLRHSGVSFLLPGCFLTSEYFWDIFIARLILFFWDQRSQIQHLISLTVAVTVKHHGRHSFFSEAC